MSYSKEHTSARKRVFAMGLNGSVGSFSIDGVEIIHQATVADVAPDKAGKLTMELLDGILLEINLGRLANCEAVVVDLRSGSESALAGLFAGYAAARNKPVRGFVKRGRGVCRYLSNFVDNHEPSPDALSAIATFGELSQIDEIIVEDTHQRVA